MITFRDIERYVPLREEKALDKWWVTFIPALGYTPLECWNQDGPEILLQYVKTYRDTTFT